jgi:hypothetical protein
MLSAAPNSSIQNFTTLFRSTPLSYVVTMTDQANRQPNKKSISHASSMLASQSTTPVGAVAVGVPGERHMEVLRRLQSCMQIAGVGLTAMLECADAANELQLHSQLHPLPLPSIAFPIHTSRANLVWHDLEVDGDRGIEGVVCVECGVCGLAPAHVFGSVEGDAVLPWLNVVRRREEVCKVAHREGEREWWPRQGRWGFGAQHRMHMQI